MKLSRAYLAGCDVLGDTGTAGFDVGSLRTTMNAVKVASVAQLGALVDKAIEIEQLAIVAGTAGGLPGAQTRQDLLVKLVAHRTVLSQAPDQSGLVVNPALETVKNDVTSAAADLNSTIEGVAYERDHAFDLLSDLVQSAEDLLNKAGDAAKTASSWLSWLPWIIGGAAVVATMIVVGPIVVPIIVAKIQSNPRQR